VTVLGPWVRPVLLLFRFAGGAAKGCSILPGRLALSGAVSQ
jgi:hypothetical protein